MRLRITHTTTFTYDEPVSEAYMEMRLTPLDAGGQRCESFRLATDPPGEVRGYVDRFGNGVRHFDTLAPHDAAGRVRAQRGLDAGGLRRPGAGALAASTATTTCSRPPYAPASDAVRGARRAVCAVPGDALATARAVMAGRARGPGLHAGRDHGEDDGRRGARRAAAASARTSPT